MIFSNSYAKNYRKLHKGSSPVTLYKDFPDTRYKLF